MKNRIRFRTALLLMIASIGVLPSTVSAESKIEAFLKDFEALYTWEYEMSVGMIDSENSYSKPVRILKTTESGISVMLDRALVTEDELAVSFLISGDFPENLTDVQLYADINVGPLLPYPPDSFELVIGGGGGGGPKLLILNENPLVVLDTASVPLMYADGYVSPSDPIQVRVRVAEISIGWGESQVDGSSQYYYEDEPLEFEFETDGAELAAQTKTFQLDHTFEIDGRTYEFHRLRFNPMQLILFTGEMIYAGEKNAQGTVTAYFDAVNYVQADADDGTKIYLSSVVSPYRGFTKKILDPEAIRSLEQTKTVTLTPCYLHMLTEEKLGGYPLIGDPAYDCSPERAVTVTIRE